MFRQKQHHDHDRSDMQAVYTLATQKRVITEFAQKKSWVIVRWYEEPAHSAKYEDTERR